jgi:hypothetical protein
VRGPEVLAKLPEPQRRDWQQQWADVADTPARARAIAVPEKNPDEKGPSREREMKKRPVILRRQAESSPASASPGRSVCAPGVAALPL